MTINELIDLVGRHPWVIVGACAPQPILAFVLGRIGDGERSPWSYLYSLLVYATCIPGMLAATLTAYSLFFIRANLLQVNLLVYGLPIVTMIVTLILIGKDVEFTAIPGFDRLSGLMVLIAVSFAIALAIAKTRIWILFGASMGTLFALAGFAFLLLKWGSYTLFRRRDEPKQDPPRFPL